ncbi:MAG TPA: pseudouridine synthase [Terracidiphilus sp.]|nr:pseudouridine synthase [Terracidiphilus sp.]
MNEEFKHPADAPEQEITSEALGLTQSEVTSEPAPPIATGGSDHGQEAEDLAATEDARPAPKLERLQKILAQAGVASRRHAEELITEGRVQVNGKTVTVLGSKADPARDHIRVDGKLLHGAERRRYFVLNKPKGYVTSVTDPEGRPTVMQFFAKLGERLYPVGRLDYQSEGLLLVTNDGELANQLTKAASGVEKTYLVKIAGRPGEAMLDRLRKGIAIEKDKLGSGKVHTAPARIHQVRPGENPWYEVVLIEGRNRELRKMFEEIGHHVEKIRRVGYGPLALDVDPGKIRELRPEEVRALQLTAEGKLKPRPVKATYFLPKEAGLTTEQREARTAARARKSFPRREAGGGWRSKERKAEGRSRGHEESRPRNPGRPASAERGGPRRFGRARDDRPEGAVTERPAAPASRSRKPGFSRDKNPAKRGDRPFKAPPREGGKGSSRDQKAERRSDRPFNARSRERRSDGPPKRFGESRSSRPEAPLKGRPTLSGSRSRKSGPASSRDRNTANRGNRPFDGRPGKRRGGPPRGKKRDS